LPESANGAGNRSPSLAGSAKLTLVPLSSLAASEGPCNDGLLFEKVRSGGQLEKPCAILTGKERDPESGLDYFGARYYWSSAGRFSSPDPLMSSADVADPQSWNRYSYTRNNPLRFVDPLGLFVWDSSLGGSLTDEELRKQLGKQANRIIGQRNAIRGGMKELERLAGTFAEGSSERQELTEALAAYGAEGTENGVTVATGASGNDAGTARPDFQSDDTGRVTANVLVTFNARNSAQDRVRAVAHEGRHARDAQNFAALNWADPTIRNSPLNFNHFQLEFRAYRTTAFVLQAQGAENVRYGGLQFWSRGWSEADRATLRTNNVAKFLQESPTYRSARPSNQGSRYVP
jgi:RHS repeat-associated protein